MDSIPCRANDLRHIGPHSIPALSAKHPPVSSSFYRNTAAFSFVGDRADVSIMEKTISHSLVGGVVADSEDVWVLDGAAQASYAKLRSWCEPADRT